jgi:hypothetical protein
MNRDRCSAFPDRRRFSPPAAGVKAGRRPPAGLGLDTGEDGGTFLRRERPTPRSWSPSEVVARMTSHYKKIHLTGSPT